MFLLSRKIRGGAWTTTKLIFFEKLVHHYIFQITLMSSVKASLISRVIRKRRKLQKYQYKTVYEDIKNIRFGDFSEKFHFFTQINLKNKGNWELYQLFFTQLIKISIFTHVSPPTRKKTQPHTNHILTILGVYVFLVCVTLRYTRCFYKQLRFLVSTRVEQIKNKLRLGSDQ